MLPLSFCFFVFFVCVCVCVCLCLCLCVCVCVCLCVVQAATSVDVKKVVLLQNELETTQRDLKAAKEVRAVVVVVGTRCEPMYMYVLCSQ